jgi:hypothetical protein
MKDEKFRLILPPSSFTLLHCAVLCICGVGLFFVRAVDRGQVEIGRVTMGRKTQQGTVNRALLERLITYAGPVDR